MQNLQPVTQTWAIDRYFQNPPEGSVTVHLTPQLAAYLLERNTKNRHLRPQRVRLLAEAIRRGEWMLNGDTIRFSLDGALIDGQHRLSAVVQAGQTIPAEMRFGLPAESQDTIDIGATRRISDQLAISGLKNATVVAATAKWIWRYNLDPRMGSANCSTVQIKEVAARYDLEKFASIGTRYRSLRGLPSAQLTAIGVLTNQPLETWHDFCERTCTGIGLNDRSDPIYRLRTAIQDGNSGRSRLTKDHTFAIAVKAWNLWCLGRNSGLLRYSRNEAFPVIR